jgi:AcrR family transcriptional regulator
VGTTPATLQARKQEFVRGAIWDAAIDLFAQKGFNETTVDEIAAAAGVSRRSFFRYFASKDDLMSAGIATFGAALTEAIRSEPRACSYIEVVRRTVLLVAGEAARQPRTRKVIQIARDNPSARQAQLSRMADLEEQVTEAFAKRCARGDAVKPRLLAHLLLATLDVTFRTWADREGQDISRVGEQVLAALSTVVCTN